MSKKAVANGTLIPTHCQGSDPGSTPGSRIFYLIFFKEARSSKDKEILVSAPSGIPTKGLPLNPNSGRTRIFFPRDLE